MDNRTKFAAAAIGLGVVLMLVGTLTHAWWIAPHGASGGLGLRGAKVCMGDRCESASYGDMFEGIPEKMMSSGQRNGFTIAGNACFFGAFVTAAVALAGLGAVLAKKKLPFPAGRITAVLAMLMIASALVFVVSKPTELMGGLSTGYGTICYMVGAFALLLGGQAVTKLAARGVDDMTPAVDAPPAA